MKEFWPFKIKGVAYNNIINANKNKYIKTRSNIRIKRKIILKI